MNATIWIIVAVFAIMSFINLKVFLFQRTIRKVHMKTSIPQKAFDAAYPPSYLPMYFFSLLRYDLAVALFFIDWKIAIICLVADYLLKILYPEQSDYKNLQKAQNVIARKKENASGEELVMLSSIDDLLKKIINTEFENQ